MRKFYMKYLASIISILAITMSIFIMLVLANKINYQNSNYTYIIGIILLFTSGFIISNHIGSKGFIVGFIQSIIILSIFSLIKLLALETDFNFSTIIKYSIYLLSGCLGGVLGVNIKKFY